MRNDRGTQQGARRTIAAAGRQGIADQVRCHEVRFSVLAFEIACQDEHACMPIGIMR